MTAAAAKGDLHIRADAEEFTGVNRRIFEGFNSMFDSWLAPVAEIERVLTALTQMNLTARVEGHYTGDYDRIATALNLVCTNLAREVQQISRHTMVMASTSEELTTTTKYLADGAVATSRLAATVSHSSNQVSEGLTAAAAGSSEMLDSMRDISQSASKASTVVDAGQGAACCWGDRRSAVRARGFSGELLGARVVGSLSELRRAERSRDWPELYCAHCDAG